MTGGFNKILGKRILRAGVWNGALFSFRGVAIKVLSASIGGRNSFKSTNPSVSNLLTSQMGQLLRFTSCEDSLDLHEFHLSRKEG